MNSKYFDNPSVLVDVFVETFERAAQDATILKAIEAMNHLIFFDMTQSDPSIYFHLDARDGVRKSRPGWLEDDRPDVTVALSVDTAHQVWSNVINPIMAVATGKMRALGEPLTLLWLAPLLGLITPIYNQVLDEKGLSAAKL